MQHGLSAIAELLVNFSDLTLTIFLFFRLNGLTDELQVVTVFSKLLIEHVTNWCQLLIILINQICYPANSNSN